VATRSLDDLRPESDVRTADGKEAGKLHAVVLDPRENRVTHLAVNTGPFFPEPGFGDPKIVAVDIDMLKDATDDGVALALSSAEFEKLPLYEHTHFFAVPDDVAVEEATPSSGLSRLWDAGVAIATSLANLGTGIAIPAEHFQRASFERHILNDTPVWRVEPNVYLGDVERVLVDEETDAIVSLVVKRGEFFPDEVVLPIHYVTEIRDGLIHAQIPEEQLGALDKYKG
jgi:sporulation protein YlmC with PRC-barrel domain